MSTLVTFIITVISSVIAGLLVYLFTRKKVKIIHAFSESAEFTRKFRGKSEKTSFQNITIKNKGNRTAYDMIIVLNSKTIGAHKMEFDVKSVEHCEVEKDINQNVLNIKCKRLLPGDKITISFLQRGENPKDVSSDTLIAVRSNETISIDEKQDTTASWDIIKNIIWIIVLLGVLTGEYFFCFRNILEDKPNAKIEFTISNSFLKKGDTTLISGRIKNTEKDVITDLDWDISTPGLKTYSYQNANESFFNEYGNFPGRIPLDVGQIDTRKGFVHVPHNIPAGRYSLEATCSYYVVGKVKRKSFSNIISVSE